MLQLNNQSRFVPSVSVLADQGGVDTLYVVVRGTFSLTPMPVVLPEQTAPVATDVYWGEPAASSLRYASDVHVGKAGTDVVLIGSAHAPGGRAVSDMLAALTVAGRPKVVRVLGDRRWRRAANGFSTPEPFLSMPLVYERAFGGTEAGPDDAGSGGVGAGGATGEGAGAGKCPDRRSGGLAEERNPVGRGFRGRRSARDVEGQALPNLEDPRWPLRRFGDRPPPAAFGFVAPSWLPRRAYAGTYDDGWRRHRAPFLPRDYDPRFANAASADLVLDDFLRGGEPLELDGVSTDGPLRTSIPTMRPRVEVTLNGSRERIPVQLETVLAEPDDRRLSLTWRAALRCDKRALRVQSIAIHDEEADACRARSS
jgi:hypothetical protein